ncbi:site-specific DNA-methyltransferase [Verrucomicrobiota bacterium]|nr:site-specific DNA-methyltransferase [Verrucomicrobiota bacterium]
MPRPDSSAYDLTDAEKRDLIKLIEQGKPLPEKYRFLLFADKREVELVWNGKSREVCTAILPFQTLEHIDEPRKEKRDDEELGLQLDSGGRQVKGWTNKLIWGDNKLILASLKSGALRRQIEDAGGLKLIYIDPPFDVGADFSMDIEIGGETFHKEPNLLEQIAYRDTWGRGADSFIAMIYERLILMRDLMDNEGSIYIHIGSKVSHLIRAIAEEVFGRDNSRAEMIWKRTSAHANVTNNYGAIHDTVFFLTKSDRWIWNQQYAKYDKAYVDMFFDQVDEKGRRYARRDLTASMMRASSGQIYTWKGITPTGSRCWAMTKDNMDALDAKGRIHWPKDKGGMPRLKFFEDEAPGVPLQDIWDDVGAMHNLSNERLDYPTQKPETFVERFIRTSSNEGDLVADFFCGSGTTAAVAEKLGRKWIATDLGKFGIHTTRKRLIQVQRELKAGGQPFRAFEVLNLGRYERQAYLNVAGRLTGKKKEQALARKEQEFRDLILKAYRAEPLPDAAFFHGKNGGRLVVVGPINLPVGRLFVEEVITECRKRGASRVDVLAFEFEMGLFPAVLDEAKQKGIDLAPKTIPPEVFDKRAVEKGQVRFADVAYIEVTERKDKKHPLAIAVELTDFSVYYSQGIADAIAADLKAGKSEVVCEQGKLIKISKDKHGIETRDVLTKQWTDWVDYWAVDFDYENRKEIIKVPIRMGVEGELPGVVKADAGEFVDFEDRWTGAYIFENEWQSFRTRQSRELELKSGPHTYPKAGRYTIAVKVVDIFGNDTMTLVPVTAG